MAKEKSISQTKTALSGTGIKQDSSQRGAVWISSGSDLVDLVVGGGRGYGYESGMVINIPGPSGGSKTFQACEIVANAYHRYKEKLKWVYDDCESGFTFDTKALYGFEIMPFKPEDRTRSKTIQDAFGNIMTFLDSIKPEEFGIYVLDSLDGLVSDEIEDQVEDRLEAHKKGKTYDKGSYQGEKPKFLSSVFLPKIAERAETKNCLIIITSQLRDNVGGGMYAPKDRVSNGRALLFYCHARIWVKEMERIERGNRVIGSVVHVTTKKVKGPRPFRECMMLLYFQYGVDNIGTNVDYLYELRSMKTGELLSAASKELLWDGVASANRDALIRYIEENNLERELTARVVNKWEDEEKEASKIIEGRKARFSDGK